MKKLLSFLLSVCIFLSGIPIQAVIAVDATESEFVYNDENGIPDTTLYKHLVAYFDQDQNGLTKAELETCTKLDLRWYNIPTHTISDLSGLQYCVNMETLYLGGVRGVDDLSPISGLTNLKVLDIESTKVSDLTPISGLTKLKSLDIGWTSISDLSAIVNLTALEELYLGGTPSIDLAPLKLLPNIKSLQVGSMSANHSALEWIAQLPNLTDLEIWGDGVTDITLLTGCTKLETLILKRCDIKKLPPMDALTQLKVLDVSENLNLTDVEGLKNLSALEKLTLNGIKATDLSAIEDLTNLKELYITDNPQLINFPDLRLMSQLNKVECDKFPELELKAKLPELFQQNYPWWMDAHAIPYVEPFVENTDLTDASYKIRFKNIYDPSDVNWENDTYLKEPSYFADGQQKKPELTVYSGQLREYLEEGVAYKVTYANNVRAGTATATVSGIGRYSGHVIKTFQIKLWNVKTTYEVNSTATSVTLRWDKVFDATHYQIFSGNKRLKTVGNVGKATVKGLKPGRMYTLSVRPIKKTGGKTLYGYTSVSVTAATALEPPKKLKARSKKKKQITLTWKKQKMASGYIISYARDKKFKKGRRVIVYEKAKATTKTIKGLKRGKTYYVRIRPYRDYVEKRGGIQWTLHDRVIGKYTKPVKVKVK